MVILFLLLSIWVVSKIVSPSRDNYWHKSIIECSSELSKLNTFKIILGKDNIKNFKEICQLFENKKITELEAFSVNKNIISLTDYTETIIDLYSDRNFTISAMKKEQFINEISLGEGLSQVATFNFSMKEIQNSVGNTNFKYINEFSDPETIRTVYPELGLSFLYYKDSKTIISVNIFTPLNSEEFTKFEDLDSGSNFISNYYYRVRLGE